MHFHDEEWKAELTAHLDTIRAVEGAAIFIHSFAVEKPIFFSAFIVRKLIEDTAVTDRLKSRSVSIQTSKSIRTTDEITMAAIQGPLDVSWAFDVGIKSALRLSFHDLASEIIHSDAFVWDTTEEVHPRFLIASYQNITRRLLWVPVEVYASMIEQVVNDAPKRWWTEKNLTTGKVSRHAK
ncbi:MULTISPECIES: hypothetical protein [Rhizobium]|jgi:hypothetical protein|uniref:hypothetical protein n=1 Tax=Rhizobium TaxID=379 RepID=UPI00037F68B4|nr:hypothetical protein [Rhizobium leguminosarum]MVO96864.1 hypothetical protein [Rhizobium leguminosarum bv. phaseoli]